MQVAIVDDLLSVKDAWVDLRSRVDDPSFYRSYEWCAAWVAGAQAAGRPDRVAIVTIRVAGRLVLLWPLALSRYGPVRVLHALADPATQYCDVLVERSPDAAAWTDAAWAALALIPEADAVHLRGVRQDGPLGQMLWRRSSQAFSRTVSPCLRLARNGEACAPRRSGKTLNVLRRHLKRLGEHGEVVFERVSRTEHLGTVLLALRLKQEWLHSRLKRSAGHDHPANRAAILTVAGQGLLTMWRLRVGSRIAAVEIGAMQDGYYYSMIQSYDEAFARCSPGRLLFWLLLESPCSGIELFDFLPGQQPHKAEWTDDGVAVANYLIALSRRGHCYRAALLVGRPVLKAVYARLPRLARLLLARRDAPVSGGFRPDEMRR